MKGVTGLAEYLQQKGLAVKLIPCFYWRPTSDGNEYWGISLNISSI